MKVFMLFTGSGPLTVLTSHESIKDEALVMDLSAKGIGKFIAYELPFEPPSST